MITLSSALKAKKNAQAGGEWIWLAEIERDDSNVLRYTNSQTDVTFMGYTWTHKPIRIQRPEQDAAGSVFTFTVQIGNADKVMSGYLRSDEIVDYCTTIYLVHRSQLADASAYMSWRGMCQKAGIAKDWASLECGPPQFREFYVPSRRYVKSRCQHLFKSPECGYVGAETVCDKSEARCRVLVNFSRFGAFPGMQSSRV